MDNGGGMGWGGVGEEEEADRHVFSLLINQKTGIIHRR